MKKYKTGLVLGGGGSRGFAHLGAIKALEEKGIKPDIISGTSAGAVVGSLIADGHKPDEIFNELSSKKFFYYTNFNYLKKGVLNLNKFEEILNEMYSVKNAEDLQIPFYACATNLNDRKAEYFNKGKLTDIVVASASIPILIKPFEINGTSYADGGIIDNLPIKPLLDKCEKIICVNLIPLNRTKQFYGTKEIFKKFHDRITHHSLRTPLTEAAILIEPPGISHHSYLSNKKAKEIFDIGYNYVRRTDLLF